MQLIFTPMMWRLIERRKQALGHKGSRESVGGGVTLIPVGRDPGSSMGMSVERYQDCARDRCPVRPHRRGRVLLDERGRVSLIHFPRPRHPRRARALLGAARLLLLCVSGGSIAGLPVSGPALALAGALLWGLGASLGFPVLHALFLVLGALVLGLLASSASRPLGTADEEPTLPAPGNAS